MEVPRALGAVNRQRKCVNGEAVVDGRAEGPARVSGDDLVPTPIGVMPTGGGSVDVRDA